MDNCSLRGVVMAAMLSVGLNVSANGEAARLLSQVAEATKALNYQGVFVYAHETAIAAMRLIHQAENGHEQERLISLSGPACEIIRDGTRVTRAFASDKTMLVERREPQDLLRLALSEPIERIAQYYDFKLLGEDRVADRSTKILLITPRTQDRYSYQLWIDTDSKLLLKSTVLDQAGAVLEQVMFVAIEIGQPISPAQLQPELTDAGFTWYASGEPALASTERVATKLKVGWMPSGFAVKNSHTQQLVPSRMPVQHVVYSDGLALVSVFIEELMDNVPPLQGYSSMGAVNAFSRMAEKYQITVVGEIPQATARKIAASVAIN
jgi:sigma-E factor negative regulatory protein RseB